MLNWLLRAPIEPKWLGCCGQNLTTNGTGGRRKEGEEASTLSVAPVAMSSEKGRNFDELMLSEERSAQRWMRRFVIAAPIVTAPLFLFPLLSWLGFSKISIFASAVYFFLIFMTEWSYLKASFGTPGRVPSSWVRTSLEKGVYFWSC